MNLFNISDYKDMKQTESESQATSQGELKALIQEFNAKTVEANMFYKIISLDFNKRIPEWDTYFDLARRLDDLLIEIMANGYNPTDKEIQFGIRRQGLV